MYIYTFLGYIDLEEIINSFQKLGVNVSRRDAELMLYRLVHKI